MCFAPLSEQTVTFALHSIKKLILITEVESVYCVVRAESLYKIRFVLKWFNFWLSVHSVSKQVLIRCIIRHSTDRSLRLASGEEERLARGECGGDNYENYRIMKYRVFILCDNFAARVGSRLRELLLEVKGASRN